MARDSILVLLLLLRGYCCPRAVIHQELVGEAVTAYEGADVGGSGITGLDNQADCAGMLLETHLLGVVVVVGGGSGGGGGGGVVEGLKQLKK
jgi:hypothetical protein